ncbi:MAG: T9SS type A sorting domain-containing protein [Bacteroidetes bacterium]|nr:T9SS type A sorting domain-containing protein [Bacteroidota bacterium]
MKIKNLLITFTLALASASSAQNQLKGWHVGNNLIDLRTGITVKPPFSSSTPHNNDGYNSMYDSEGKLLFYIAQNKVFNKFSSQLGFLSSVGGSLGQSLSFAIAPWSDNSQCAAKYFIFFVVGQCCGLPDLLQYVVVDMQANNGNGTCSAPTQIGSFNSGFTNIALSKKNGNTRYLYVNHKTGIGKFDVTNAVSAMTTIFTANSTELTETGELEISDNGDKLAWTEGTFTGGSVGNDVNVLTLDPTNGLPISSTLYSFNSGNNTANNQLKGLEFDKTGQFLYIANRNTGLVVKDLSLASSVPPNLVSGSALFSSTMLEKSFNGNDIICGSSTGLSALNTTSNLFGASSTFILPNAFTFFLAPRQVDGENYDLNPNINIDVNIYTATSGGTWLGSSNPFYTLQQNSYLGNLTSFSTVRFGGDFIINPFLTLNITGMELQYNTNTEIKINGGSDLTITGSYLHAHPCGLMWKGINVNNNNSSSATNLTLTRLSGRNKATARLTDAIKGIFADENNSLIKVLSSSSLFDNERSVVIINGNTNNEFSTSYFQQLNPLRDQTYGSNYGYGSKYGITGIELQNTTGQTIGLTTGSGNTFNGGQYGIDGLASSFSSYYNTVQNVKNTGIRSNGNYISNANVNVQSNTFNYNYYDIDCFYQNNLTVQKNTFNNCSGHSVSWNYNWGRKLIVGGDNSAGSGTGISTDANTFSGCNWSAVRCLDNENLATNIQINYNTIQNALTSSGVILEQTNLTTANLTFQKFSIANNTINQLAWPITIQNVKGNILPGQPSPTYYNNLNPVGAPAFDNFANVELNTINVSTQYVAGATGIRNYNSPQTKIKANTVNSDNNGDWQNIGVDVSDSPMSFVWSNNISAGRGIESRVNMTNANIMCNSLSYCVVGIQLGWEWLRNTNDIHGIPNSYNRQNTFANTHAWGADMECYNSSPSSNQWVTPNTTNILYTGVTGNIINNLTSMNPVCGSASRVANSNNPENNTLESGKLSVSSSTLFTQYKNWHSKFEAKTKDKLTPLPGVSSAENQRLTDLVSANENLSAHNYSAALVPLQNPAGANLYESNLATVYSIIANKHAQNYRKATTQEKNTLIAIAELHPIEAGPAVYNARTILRADFNLEFGWQDSTGASISASSSNRNINNNNAVVDEESTITIFPNPSNGKVNLTVPKNNLTYTYSVSSVLGVVMAKGEFQNGLELDLKTLPQGVYVVIISNTAAPSVRKTLILNK